MKKIDVRQLHQTLSQSHVFSSYEHLERYTRKIKQYAYGAIESVTKQ
jgi:hypothetical protein